MTILMSDKIDFKTKILQKIIMTEKEGRREGREDKRRGEERREEEGEDTYQE